MMSSRLGCRIVIVTLLALVHHSPAGAQTPCAPAPRTDCRRSDRGTLLLENDGGEAARRLVWRWQNGEATHVAEFGDPLSTADYGLCVYAGPSGTLVSQAAAPPGPPRWRSANARGFRYRDAEVAGGVKAIALRSGTAGKARISVIGRRLSFLEGAPALPITVQLVSNATGVCWESVYSADNKPESGPQRFLARHRGIPRPNVILIHTDDQRSDTIGYMPALMEQIAAKGVRFENTFSPNPVCLPSRASILTGNYAHTHGVLSNGPPDGGPLRFIGPDQETIAVWLQSEGYRTGFFGKYHGYFAYCSESSCPVPPGWDEWRSFLKDDYFNYEMSKNGTIVPYGGAPEDYSTDVMRDEVLAFLDAHPDEPLFVYFAPFAPHVSVANGFFPVPAPRHEGALASVPPWRPASYMEEDVSDKPAIIQARPAVLDPVVSFYFDLQRYLGLESLLAVDEAIAAIVAKLEEQGRLTDTLIIFTSDHGYSDGEHRLFGKLCPYEECIRIPLVMRYPRVLHDRPETRDEPAMVIDFAPTIAEWARVSPERVPPIDGLSLVGVARGTQATWRDTVLLEQWMVRRYAGVRTAEWKYVLLDTGERELYDLVNDAAELENVADQFPALAAELEGRIVELGGSLP
jgi:arylsulfatase A-like enzyme